MGYGALGGLVFVCGDSVSGSELIVDSITLGYHLGFVSLTHTSTTLLPKSTPQSKVKAYI
jgi:hypothetical protein